MSNLYIFSHNDIVLKHEAKIFNINSFSKAKITNYNNEILEVVEKDNNQTFFSELIFDNNQQQMMAQNIRTYFIENNLYCEIIHTGQASPIQKFTTKSCEIFIYNNYVEILSNNKFYSYYFHGNFDNNALEQDDIVYIFNENNILEFNTKINTFCINNCKKYAKNSQKTEILCDIPKTNCYFKLYVFDIKNGNVSTKNYKNDNSLIFDKYTFPLVFFHLTKCNIDSAKTLIDVNLNYDNLKNYLCQFDDIWEIDGKYFLSSSSQICKIKFEIQNNIIIDVD